ncbi:hypothetical protein HDU67_008538 [Dinochytrium kinnereticum]|nr:hypothetical protein HDU67_008538 [Dinochytrium kinnereticum]
MPSASLLGLFGSRRGASNQSLSQEASSEGEVAKVGDRKSASLVDSGISLKANGKPLSSSDSVSSFSSGEQQEKHASQPSVQLASSPSTGNAMGAYSTISLPASAPLTSDRAVIIPAVKALEEQIRFADISAQQLGIAISNNRTRGAAAGLTAINTTNITPIQTATSSPASSSPTKTLQPSPTSAKSTSAASTTSSITITAHSNTASELFKVRAELEMMRMKAEVFERQCLKMFEERRKELLATRELAVTMVGWKSVLDMIAAASSGKREDGLRTRTNSSFDVGIVCEAGSPNRSRTSFQTNTRPKSKRRSNIVSDGLSGTLEGMLRDLKQPIRSPEEFETLGHCSGPENQDPSSDDRNEMIEQLLRTLSDSTPDEDLHNRMIECLHIVKKGATDSSKTLEQISAKVLDLIVESQNAVDANLRMARAAMATVADGTITPIVEPKSPLSMLDEDETSLIDGFLEGMRIEGVDEISPRKSSIFSEDIITRKADSQKDIKEQMHKDNLTKLSQIMKEADELSASFAPTKLSSHHTSYIVTRSSDAWQEKMATRGSTMSETSADANSCGGRSRNLRRHRLGIIVEKQGDEFVLDQEYARVQRSMEYRTLSMQPESFPSQDVNHLRGWNSASAGGFFRSKRNNNVFTRFVEVGRVVLVNYGPYNGKLAVIVDIVDHSRVLIDGPNSGVPRQVIALKRVNLTSIAVKVPRAGGTPAIKAAIEKADVAGKWSKTAWAKKLHTRTVRQNLTDFDRFKLLVARKQRRAVVGKEFSKLRKAALQKGTI